MGYLGKTTNTGDLEERFMVYGIVRPEKTENKVEKPSN